jgi:hypothetical protein
VSSDISFASNFAIYQTANDTLLKIGGKKCVANPLVKFLFRNQLIIVFGLLKPCQFTCQVSSKPTYFDFEKIYF